MPKEPMLTELDIEDVEATAERVAEDTIEEMVPPALQEQAASALKSIIQGTRRRPIAALAMATAVGYVVALLTGR